MAIITAIQTFILHVPVTRNDIADSTHRISHWGVPGVIIRTDAGIDGYGFSGTHAHLATDRLITSCIADAFGPLLIGKDALDVRGLWEELVHHPPIQWVGRCGITHLALGAIDVALWDIQCKHAEQPLWKFLGGNAAKKVEGYNTDGGWLNWPMETLVSDCRRLVESEGYPGVKIKVGSAESGRDLQRIEAVRKAIGPNVKLMVDANGKFDLSEAILLGQHLRDFDVVWFEEPIWYDDVAGHAELAKRIETPIALGEQLYRLDDFRNFIGAKAVRFVQPDVTRVAGITEWWEVADLAAAHQLPVASHVGDMAQVHQHLAVAHPACSLLEYIPWTRECFTEPAAVKDGAFVLPQQPGRGHDIESGCDRKVRREMKITSLETWLCKRNEALFDSSRTGRAPLKWDVVVVRLGTDEKISGHATALAARSGNITQSYLHENIAPVVLGRDVTDREAIWHELWNIDRHLTFFPVYLPGPVDVALWDIAAQAAGLPLYKYLGAYRDSLPVYASSLFLPSVQKYVDEAKSYLARGFTAYKAHPPGPWKRDMEVHRALREQLGKDVVLMTDPVAEYSLEEAIRVGRDLERLNYHWFEEPFRDFELSKYAKLCAALDIPIAGTETTRGGPWGVAQAIAANAVDIVRADVSWKAGVTGTMKIAHLAEAHGMRCEVHCTTMGFMDIANLHVSCAIRNCEFFELLVPEEPFRFPMKDAYPIDGQGVIHVPQKPGVGVELDWAAIDRTCAEHRVSKV